MSDFTILYIGYFVIGLLEGHFYDRDGRPTQAMEEVEKSIVAGKKEKAQEQNDRELFPPCNSEWTQAAGGRVWCTRKRYIWSWLELLLPNN